MRLQTPWPYTETTDATQRTLTISAKRNSEKRPSTAVTATRRPSKKVEGAIVIGFEPPPEGHDLEEMSPPIAQ